MKVVCLKNQLKEALFFAERNSGKVSNMPILQSVYIGAGNGVIKIISTNLETGFETTIPSKIIKEGEIVVPIKVLSQLIGNFSDEKVTFEKIKNNLNVSTTSISSIIKGYPTDDFPKLPTIKDKSSFIISREDLFKGLKSVSNAVSSSNIKPEISSVFFYNQKKIPMKIVATDSFRLAEKTLKNNVNDVDSFLLPHRSAVELIRLLEYGDGDINVLFDKNQINFVSNNFKFVSRLTEGSFPGYETIIPKTSSTEVIVDKNKFTDALRAASVFSGNLNEVNLNIIVQDNLAEIRTQHSEIGEHTSQIPITVNGDNISLNFNYNYILDGLQNLTSKDITLLFSGDDKPMLMKNNNDSSYLYLVMPMRNV